MKKLFELNKNDKQKRLIPISYAVAWRCLARPGTNRLFAPNPPPSHTIEPPATTHTTCTAQPSDAPILQ